MPCLGVCRRIGRCDGSVRSGGYRKGTVGTKTTIYRWGCHASGTASYTPIRVWGCAFRRPLVRRMTRLGSPLSTSCSRRDVAGGRASPLATMRSSGPFASAVDGARPDWRPCSARPGKPSCINGKHADAVRHQCSRCFHCGSFLGASAPGFPTGRLPRPVGSRRFNFQQRAEHPRQ